MLSLLALPIKGMDIIVNPYRPWTHVKDHHKLLTGITISVGDEGTSQRAVSSEVDIYELFDGRGPDGMREAMLLSESITG